METILKTIDADDRLAISNLIIRSGYLGDSGRYMEWVDLFVESGQYSMITLENYRDTGLYLYKDKGFGNLQERAAYQLGVWQTPRAKTTHTISVVELEETAPDECSVISTFIMTRTGDQENTKLYASGTYRDTVVRTGDGWRFKERTVIIDSNLLPAEFTDLI